MMGLKLGSLIPQSAAIPRLLKEGLRQQGRLYAIAMAAMIVSAATSAGVAWVMEKIVDALSRPDSRAYVLTVATMVMGIFIVKGMATYVQVVFMSRAGNRIVAHQQSQVFSKLMRQGLSYFNAMESSEIIMRVTQGAQACRRLIDIIVVSAVRDTLTLLALLGVMIYQQPLLSAVSLLVGPVALYGIRRILRKVKEIMESELASMSEIYKVLQEGAGGIQVVKIFSLENTMRDRMDRAVRTVEKRANAISRLEAITSPMMETLSGVVIAGVVVLSAYNIFGGEPTTAGQLMSFVTALLMAYEPAKRLSRMRVSIEASLVGVRMVLDMLDMPDTQIEAPDAAPLAPGPGEVEMAGVRFGYAEDTPILKGVNLVFPAGRISALVGPSGGGKSTLINLAMRMFDPTEGTISIDGQDLRMATLSSIRQRISFVGQTTFLFSTTIRENIRCARFDATDEEVVEAAKAANAHEFIEALSEGYDTPVGENGAFLSGGQRQRLAIARAIVKRSDILFLDEATSALDSHSEALIQDALGRATQGKTVIVIAHRLTTILNADQVFFIEAGQVAESGTIETLLAGPTRFRTLYDAQFEGVSERGSRDRQVRFNA
ncbi:ABC transporter ATP-binding protein [Palleronia abyssalis]|uniref:Multidrug export ATP-binding/permease protein n=1 Tax=Palleronia abyssalis TaxID=1501240 RepID=A0A2R8BZC5_9RHOB|nr:ABC transporter ATP-binding protein [Palleronia abyssalis]SPJ25502.1 Putative multidrug export ATP-binding/permease protein [Palleronia abyssalis]